MSRRIKKYCGSKTEKPDGYDRMGSRYECLRAGIYVGKELAEKRHKQAVADAGLESRRKQKEHIEQGILEGKKQVHEGIKKYGLAHLKEVIRLNDLNKDEVRSICVRYTGTANAITGYSNMSVEQMKNALVELGFQR